MFPSGQPPPYSQVYNPPPYSASSASLPYQPPQQQQQQYHYQHQQQQQQQPFAASTSQQHRSLPPQNGYPQSRPPTFGKHDHPFLPSSYNALQNIPPGVEPIVWEWFKSVDENGDGKITAQELQTSLMNNNCTPFNSETCRLMVGMFDVDRNGTIDIYEFSSLWKYIQEWRACFDSFDTDRSGTIDVQELSNAFKTFGYNLSPNFCQLCIRVFDRRGHSSIKFDDFIQCCVMLKVLSSKFMEKDVNKTGVIRIYYEEFMKMALDNTIV